MINDGVESFAVSLIFGEFFVDNYRAEWAVEARGDGGGVDGGEF